MNMIEEETVAAPLFKVTSAWGAVGFAHIVDFAQLVASILAAIYTLCLLVEWVWKKFHRKTVCVAPECPYRQADDK